MQRPSGKKAFDNVRQTQRKPVWLGRKEKEVDNDRSQKMDSTRSHTAFETRKSLGREGPKPNHYGLFLHEYKKTYVKILKYFHSSW